MEPDILNTPRTDLKSSDLFFNRELSFIEFNKRVLAEASDKMHPLLERFKFITIFSTNLDEFFMIRVAGLKGQIAADVIELSYDGRTPRQQLEEVRKRLLPLYELQRDILVNEIMPELEKENINIHDFNTLSRKEKENLKKYFCESILPILTPLSLDPGHPFPRVINLRLNIAFVLTDESKKVQERKVAFLQIPSVLPRLIPLNRPDGFHFVLIEHVIKAFAEILFPGYNIEAANTFRVTRDADIEIAEDEAEDLLSEIAEQIKQRRWGTAAVRLEVNIRMPQYLVNLLMHSLGLEETDVYIHNRPLNLSDFMQLTKLDLRQLKDTPFATRTPQEFINGGIHMFNSIRKHDILVHHPFDSFTNSTLKFINEAADDPNVLAIKITLYRTGRNSPVVAALERAAENGKDVMAFVELKARFDEENNITWAKELEGTGVHVVYGLIGLKTHCKIAMVVRKESDKLRTYLHMSTGNYNQITARLYTDVGYFTARREFTMDAINLFNYLTGYSHNKDWKHFIVAPVNLYQKTIQLIEREAELHTPENPGFIFAKMNAIAHRQVIPALYKASQKGVKIRLLVRGICCLKPGIPGVSENIEVRSILGRFLEHSRIFYFKNGGEGEYYLSSADWMSRNLHNRVELMFPIYDKKLQTHLMDILNLYWSDNTKSWELLYDGAYQKVDPGEDDLLLSAQGHYLEEIMSNRK